MGEITVEVLALVNWVSCNGGFCISNSEKDATIKLLEKSKDKAIQEGVKRFEKLSGWPTFSLNPIEAYRGKLKQICIMKRGTPVDKDYEEETAANHLKEQLVLGDLIWLRQGESSWWPAQIVDENAVSYRNKPRNRSARDVLVRLYGSYYWSAIVILDLQFIKQSNGSHAEIFRKALEQCCNADDHCLSFHMNAMIETPSHQASQIKQSRLESHRLRFRFILWRKGAVELLLKNSGLQDAEDSISKGNGFENQESEAIPRDGTQAKGKAVCAGQNNESRAGFRSNKYGNDALKSEDCRTTIKQSQVKNGNLISEKSLDKKIDKRTRSGMSKEGQENLKAKSPRSVSSQVNMKNGNLHSKGAQEEVEGEKQIQNGARKKLKLDRSSIARVSRKRVEPTKQSHTGKSGIPSRKAQEVAKRKDTEEDKLKKQVGSAGKSPKKSLAVSWTKENGASLLSESVKANQAELQKKLQQDDANLVKASPEEFPEPSPRRIRVMQNLGLVAPSGSPFDRIGQGSRLRPKGRPK
ncbi:PWWP domain [Dillenia turbinata]|uniref:PWWP domain n=1 Tax=Dillenia turbinata TaxID=194707 RepID=A0AAN8ZL05_9MAGN